MDDRGRPFAVGPHRARTIARQVYLERRIGQELGAARGIKARNVANLLTVGIYKTLEVRVADLFVVAVLAEAELAVGTAGDGCSADCASDETCGRTVGTGEVCKDGAIQATNSGGRNRDTGDDVDNVDTGSGAQSGCSVSATASGTQLTILLSLMVLTRRRPSQRPKR